METMSQEFVKVWSLATGSAFKSLTPMAINSVLVFFIPVIQPALLVFDEFAGIYAYPSFSIVIIFCLVNEILSLSVVLTYLM